MCQGFGSTWKQGWPDIENERKSDIRFLTLCNVDTTSMFNGWNNVAWRRYKDFPALQNVASILFQRCYDIIPTLVQLTLVKAISKSILLIISMVSNNGIYFSTKWWQTVTFRTQLNISHKSFDKDSWWLLSKSYIFGVWLGSEYTFENSNTQKLKIL